MKLRIIQDAHYRISSAKSQAFKAGIEVEVPKATAEALIKRGVAAPADQSKPSTAKE